MTGERKGGPHVSQGARLLAGRGSGHLSQGGGHRAEGSQCSTVPGGSTTWSYVAWSDPEAESGVLVTGSGRKRHWWGGGWCSFGLKRQLHTMSKFRCPPYHRTPVVNTTELWTQKRERLDVMLAFLSRKKRDTRKLLGAMDTPTALCSWACRCGPVCKPIKSYTVCSGFSISVMSQQRCLKNKKE